MMLNCNSGAARQGEAGLDGAGFGRARPGKAR